MTLYTRRGDDGTTGLYLGGRVAKDALQTEAYGTVDEAVAALGVARCELPAEAASAVLDRQQELFTLSAQLATDPSKWDRLEQGVSRLHPDVVSQLEASIDRVLEEHPLASDFIAPGADRGSASLDLARTVVRRAERRLVSLDAAGLLPDDLPRRYLNRLSDYLFALARSIEETAAPLRPDRQARA